MEMNEKGRNLVCTGLIVTALTGSGVAQMQKKNNDEKALKRIEEKVSGELASETAFKEFIGVKKEIAKNRPINELIEKKRNILNYWNNGEIRELQAVLGLPEEQQDGKWGKKTENKFDETLCKIEIDLVLKKAPEANSELAYLFEEGERRKINKDDLILLACIAFAESRFNPAAINKNKDGSIDIGFFQLNNRYHKQLDLEIGEININCALDTFKNDGSRPWNSSRWKWQPIVEHINS